MNRDHPDSPRTGTPDEEHQRKSSARILSFEQAQKRRDAEEWLVRSLLGPEAVEDWRNGTRRP